MKKLLFLLLFIPFLGTSQGTFTAPVGYNTGAPTAAPSGVGTRWRFDLLTGKKYTWNPDAMAWDEDPRGIDQISGCSAPLYTPGYNQSTFAINGCTAGQGGPKLYQYSGSAWLCLNCFSGPNIYAGSGITLSGTAPDITISADDNSPTNELQTLSISGQNLTLSNSGGTVAIPGGGSLGTGFTAGGGEGVIPSATGILSGDLILDNTGNYAVRIGDINGGVNGIGMEITDTRFAFGNNFGIGNFSIISNFDGGPSAFYIAITGANDEMKFTPDGVIYTDLGDGLGMSYAARYPDILDTDRSIPDVGLVKELITDSLSTISSDALGTGFVDGGGSGTIPDPTTAQYGLNSLKFANNEFSDLGDFIGTVASADNYYGSGFNNSGDGEFTTVGKYLLGDYSMQYVMRPNLVRYEFADSGSGASASYTLSSAGMDVTAPLSSFTGAISIGGMADADAPNGSMFYSTDRSKLCYKDPGGTVNELY